MYNRNYGESLKIEFIFLQKQSPAEKNVNIKP